MRGGKSGAVLLVFHSTLQAFGAPFIVAHVGGEQETFFGSDRFEILAHALGICLPDRQTDRQTDRQMCAIHSCAWLLAGLCCTLCR